MFRSAKDGKPLFASIVAVDTRESQAVLRALHDPSAPESRIGFALAPETLDAHELHGNDEYEDALRTLFLQEYTRQMAQKRGP
jgi:hypothetical protein